MRGFCTATESYCNVGTYGTEYHCLYKHAKHSRHWRELCCKGVLGTAENDISVVRTVTMVCT